MIHLNDYISRMSGWKGIVCRLFGSTMPESYSATSIGDILNSKGDVIPTKTFLFPGVFFYNSAMIFLETSAVFTNLSPYLGRITDLNNDLEVELSTRMLERERDFLIDGKRIYEPILFYHVSSDRLRLVSFDHSGPTKPERDDSVQSLKNLRIA